MIGTFKNAIIAITAEVFLTLSILPPKDLIIKYPTYVKNKIKVVVNLGSQIHGFPQIGVAHIGPVINTKDIKSVPISAHAVPVISHLSFFVDKNKKPEIIAMK